MKKWAARLALVILALVAWVLAPIIALCMWAWGGELSKQRAALAAERADETLNALTGNIAFRWMSEGAANNSGSGWKILAALLDAGWPGHIEQYRAKNA